MSYSMERYMWQETESANKKLALTLTSDKELNAANNHMSLEVDPSPGVFR